MSVHAEYTMTCDKKPCAERVGPHSTLDAAREAAEQAGWKLDYTRSLIRTGDRCPAHIAPLDRVRWD